MTPVAMDMSAALWFLPFVLPISLWAAWSDMKFMKIPNQSVLALLLVFALVGLIALPFGDYLWRWTHALAILAVGFIANMVRLVGAGDAKFAAAMAPFVAVGDLQLFLPLFAAILLGAFAAHRLLKHVPAYRAASADWLSWGRQDFPMGLALSGTLAFYLLMVAGFGA